MFSPITTLFTYFPLIFFSRVAFLLLVDIVAGVVVYKLCKKNKIEKRKAAAIEAVIVCTTFVMFLAVLGRRSLDYYRFGTDVVTYYSMLFCDGAVDMNELFLNVAVFMPIGYFAYAALDKHKLMWTVLVGFVISFMIEFSQFVLKCGFVSSVDIIHNTLGTFFGGVLAMASICIYRRIKNKRQIEVEKE